jgi:hypothetical protein
MHLLHRAHGGHRHVGRRIAQQPAQRLTRQRRRDARLRNDPEVGDERIVDREVDLGEGSRSRPHCRALATTPMIVFGTSS